MTSLATPGSATSASADAFPGACSWSHDLDKLSNILWDVVVIGAGPAGAASAYLLAKAGKRVLLLERSTWPRQKVCGGCLSASAVVSLREIGLGSLLLDATPITSSFLHQGHATASLPIRDACVISREVLDASMVEAFRARGGEFVPQASAALLPADVSEHVRWVRVTVAGRTIGVRAQAILACDGLGGSSLVDEPWAQWSIARDAYIGVATTLEPRALRIEPGTIHMHIGRGGYVGAVRNPDGTVHLAAALDAKRSRSYGGPATMIEAILDSCGRSVYLDQPRLKGTPTLTRRRQLYGGHRVLAVGDSCGYIEPFTGEGIAWALRTAIEASELVSGEWSNRFPQRWREIHDITLRRKQGICRGIRFALRSPVLVGVAIRLLGRVPALSTLITRADRVDPC